MRKKYLTRRFNYVRLQYSIDLYSRYIDYFGRTNRKMLRKKPKLSIGFYGDKVFVNVDHFRTTYEVNENFEKKLS